MAAPKITTAERIEQSTVFVPDGCRIWCAPNHRNGYGTISINNVQKYVHRVAWELEKGPIPTDLVIDHKCRNRRCCRVEHLRLVTQRINAIENNSGRCAVNTQKSHCPKCGGDYSYRSRGQRVCKSCELAKAHYRYITYTDVRNRVLENRRRRREMKKVADRHTS